MIIRTLIVSVVLILCYSVCIQSSTVNKLNSQSNWQENLVKGENLFFGHEKYSTIIVGSSLSATLHENVFHNTYNLGLVGCSIYDGLAILKNMSKDRLPSTVLIETNYLLRDEKKFFVDNFSREYPNYFKKYLPAFRENHKPISVMAAALTHQFQGYIDSAQYCLVSKHQPVNINNLSYSKVLSEEVIDYRVKPDSMNVINHLAKIRDYVNYLEENNVKVIFFEMPVDQSLRSLPKIVAVRNGIKSYFPTYNFILPPADFKVSTLDLEHLDNKDATAYSNFLLNRVSHLTDLARLSKH